MERARKGRRNRLSHLPEPIIYHILSFLDSKSAVQTSVLSRSWRCAWKNVPVLDLNTASFERYSRFERFGDKVMSLRYPLSLRKVCFVDEEIMHKRRDHPLFERVIEHAFSHDAQHVVIELEHELELEENFDFSRLFCSVTNSSNVKTLEVRWVKLDYKSEFSGFRSLTTLNLYCCWLDARDVFSDSNFPCLKNLAIEKCECYGYSGSISGLHLLSLMLLPVPFQQVEVCAPKLKFLSFCTSEVPDSEALSKFSLPSLEHAEVGGYFPFELRDIREQHLISLFQDLHNVKSLTLRSQTVKVLSRISGVLEQQPAPFTRLAHLKLFSRSNSVPMEVVNYFRKGSPGDEPRIEFIDEWE
ncbi:unnamed protein product [Linum tenue]|uniref:F-box domain-containing protein n=1 Tax=Linum tenue TaxID=586396 RepID=A0AAV0NMU2_9ROSI|nr:unnamed protein product [Linum tenue]